MGSLREHSIVTDDENGEIIPHATMIGDAESSLLSFFAGGHLPTNATSPFNSGLSAVPEGVVAGDQVDDSLVDLDVLHAIRARLRGNSGNHRRSFEAGDVPRSGRTAMTRSHRFDPLIGGQRRRSSSVVSPRENTDSNKSFMSLTPSLKAALDAEDSDKTIHDVVATAQRTHVDRLYIPKRRPPHASVSLTEISGQVEDLTLYDGDSEDDSMIADPSRQDSTQPITFLCPPPRATGIYQHNNTGLPRGESDCGSSNLDLNTLEFSSVIDDEFAASGFAPPTMGVPIGGEPRRRLSLDCFSPAPENTSAAADSSPIKTPAGHDFPVISPLKTPGRKPTLNVIESSPIKTPGGGDFPVDPPGSEGFPIIEPGEFIALSPGEIVEESEPAVSSEAGESSVIHHTPPRVKAQSISLPTSRKNYRSLLSPILAARARNFSSPPQYPSSPAEEIQQLRPVIEGGVQRRVSQYELPGDSALSGRRNSIVVPPGRAASPSMDPIEVGGQTAHSQPGGSYGKMKASPFLLALQEKQEKRDKQDKTMDEAKCVVASVKSKLGSIMGRGGAKDANGGLISGDKEIEVDDLNGTFEDDENIESSSPAKFVSRSPKMSQDKGKGKEKVTEDDMFSPATAQASAHSRKASCEDDPNHPLRRRQSLSKATYKVWMAPSHKKKVSVSKLSMEGAAPKMLPLVGDGGSEQIAAISAPRLNENIVGGSAFVSNDAFDGPIVWNDADRRLGNVSPNNDPLTAPASLHNFPVAAPFAPPVGTSHGAGSVDANGSRPPPRIFDYPSRVRAIDPPSEIVNSDEETPAGFTSNDSSFFDVSMGRFIEVANDMRRDGTVIRENLERSIQAAYGGANPAQGMQADRGAVIGGATVTAASGASTKPLTSRLPFYQETPPDAGDGNVSTGAEQTDEQRHAQQYQQATWDSTTTASAASSSLEGNANANPLNIGLTEYHGAQQDLWTPMQRSRRDADARLRLPPLATELGFEAQSDERVQVKRLNRYDGGVASPGVEASGSAQHDQSSPITPRGPVSAVTQFPPRSSSLKHATRTAPVGQNITPARTALNGVPAPAAVPPSSLGGAGPPVYQGLQVNPLRQPSPLRRTPSLLEREHPLGSPMTRSPSSTFSGQDRRGTRFTPSTLDTNVSGAGVIIRNVSNSGDMFSNSPVRLVSSASLPSHLRMESRNSTPMPGAWLESPTKSDPGEVEGGDGEEEK